MEAWEWTPYLVVQVMIYFLLIQILMLSLRALVREKIQYQHLLILRYWELMSKMHSLLALIQLILLDPTLPIFYMVMREAI